LVVSLGDGVVAVRDFTLVMRTNFRAIDFPPRTLSRRPEEQTPGGWRLTCATGTVGGFGVG